MVADLIRSRPTFAVVLLLAALWAGAFAWVSWAGLRVTGFGDFAATLLLLTVNLLIYRRFPLGDRAANMLSGFTVFFALSTGSVLLSYLAATLDRPFADPWLSRADAALGFDWVAWWHFVQSHQALHNLLHTAYASLVAQVLICLVAFPLSGMMERNRELLACFAASLLPTLVLFGFFPAVSAWVYYKADPAHTPEFLVALEAIRNGKLPVINLQRLDGLVTFPSFHTAGAIILAYVARGTRYFFLSAAVNALMVVSTLTSGGHYFIDIIGGIVVGLGSILLVRVAMRRVGAKIAPATP